MTVRVYWFRWLAAVGMLGVALSAAKAQDVVGSAGIASRGTNGAGSGTAEVSEGTGSLICKGPYIQVPRMGTTVVMWEAVSNLVGVVRYGLGDDLGQKVENVHPRVMEASLPTSGGKTTNGPVSRKFYVYEAVLNDLKPGTRYAYRVEFGGGRTPVHHFTTLARDAEATRFIVYGDTRSDPPVHTALAARFRAHAPDFILHTGDLVARGRDYSLWSKEFFTPMAGVIDEVPFFSVIGNHEEDGTNYLGYFHLPGKELWYSFDVGPVHVLALDFHFPNRNSEQFRFAEQDLARSRAPWKLVVLHTPVFNVGGHASDWGQTTYLPLFHRTKVDLVLSGHSHLYERFRPLAPAGARQWAITHVTTGGGGANLHRSFDHPALVVRETTKHYMVFEATREKLEGQAIRADGSVLDRFALTKRRGRMPADYLAQVYPEELLRLFCDAAPSLNGRAVAVPRTNEPARVLFNPTALKNSGQPAALEIGIAPESAPYYEMDGGPTRTATPGAGQTNQWVWASVRSSGRQAITAKTDGELVPPLLFMAKVRAVQGETVSYGAPCRVSKTAAELLKKIEQPR